MGIVVLILALGGLIFGLPRLQHSAEQAEIEQAVIRAATAAINAQLSDQPDGEMIVSDVVINGVWSFGLLVTRAPDPALQIHAAPDLRLFITQREESSGEVNAALEYTPEFYARLEQIPDGLISQDAATILRDAQTAARGESTDVRLNYALPWELGQTWLLTGAPHPDNAGETRRPWSALDFAYDPGVGIVRSTEAGVIWRSTACPNFIRVDHAGGYQTGYYHVVNERVRNGQSVLRGDALASEGMGMGCGGYASGPHVHMSLRYFDMRLSMAGKSFSGWVILDSTSAYNGCMVRVSDNLRRCTPRAEIPYDDDVTVVLNDSHYDYNRERRPDLWGVNLRPDDSGTVLLEIFDGVDFTTPIFVPRTSLPPQPAELNTAFSVGDYNHDGVPDVWLFHRRMDTSESTALRILDGANPQYLLLDTPTALPMLNDHARFAVADFNGDNYLDVYAIIPDYMTNQVAVNVINGVDFKALLGERTAAMPAPSQFDDIVFAVADYNDDDRPDLWLITPRGAESNSVSVKILEGNGYQATLTESAVALRVPYTDPELYSFVVTDYNSDDTPDIWLIDQLTGAMQIVSGKDFKTVLFEGTSAIKERTGWRYQVIGSDRARLNVPPQPATHVSPADGDTVNGTKATLRFTMPGLAQSITLQARDAFGLLLHERRLPQNLASTCANNICAIELDMGSMALETGQWVYWSVAAENAYGQTTSGSRGFKVNP